MIEYEGEFYINPRLEPRRGGDIVLWSRPLHGSNVKVHVTIKEVDKCWLDELEAPPGYRFKLYEDGKRQFRVAAKDEYWLGYYNKGALKGVSCLPVAILEPIPPSYAKVVFKKLSGLFGRL